jgi:hypothetical protein
MRRKRNNTARPSRRRLFRLETLEARRLLAVGLSFLEPPVAQFATQGTFVGDASEGGFQIGSLVDTVSQVSLSVNQTEAFDDVLYSVGHVNGTISYSATNLSTGASQRVDLPALLAGDTFGQINDVEKVSGQIVFVGGSQFTPGVNTSATSWDILSNPTAVPQPPGALSQDGSAEAITPNGFIGGTTATYGAFIYTSQGSFSIPKNQTGVGSTVLSISDSGRYASGGIGGNSATVWKAEGTPENGNYELLNFTWQIPQDAQGTLTMFQVVDNATYGGLGMGSFIDVDGDKHHAIWSLSDGSLIKDFGPNAEIKEAKYFGGTLVIATNDAAQAGHLYVFDTGKVYDLATLLGTTDAVSFTNGGLFETTIDGQTAIGVSYTENGAMKASMFDFVTPRYDLSGDVTATSVTLPYAAEFVFHEVGANSVNVTVTDATGTGTPIRKTVQAASSGVVTQNGVTSLRIGGSDSRDDDFTLEALAGGGYRVADQSGSVDYTGKVDQIFANLGGGDDVLTLTGADQTFDLAGAKNIERIDVSSAAVVQLLNITKAAVVNASGAVGGLLMKTDAADQLQFSTEWKYGGRAVVKGVSVHVLMAGEVALYIENELLQNPKDPLDTNGDGEVTPIDALLIINYLNQHGAGSLSSDSSPFLIDTNGDNSAAPIDVLMVVNFINRQSGLSLEGEGSVVRTTRLAQNAAQISRHAIACGSLEVHENRRLSPSG